MKRMIRRCAIGLTMFLGSLFLLNENTMTVEATGTAIEKVEVTVTIPKAGMTNNKVEFKVLNNEAYTVTPNGTWNGPGGDSASVFIDGNDYRALFTVKANAGYELTRDTVVHVNGSSAGVALKGGSTDNLVNIPASQFEFLCNPDVIGTINFVELKDVPTGEIGDKAKKYFYDGENYEASGTWQCYDSASKSYIDMDEEDVFKQGEIYRLVITVDPDDGYVLSYNCEITVNGNASYWKNFSSISAECVIDASHVKEIEQIAIRKDALPTAVVGESFKEESINVPVDEKYNCTVSGYWVSEKDGSRKGTFENGEAYSFVLEIIPNKGYSLSENLMIELDEEEWAYVESPVYATCPVRTSFATFMNKIQLLKLPTIAVGGTLQTGTFKVEVPADAKYTAEAYWQVRGQNGYDEVTTNKVEAGKMYRLEVEIYAESGYEFADSVIINAYGVDYKESNNSETYVDFQKEFSFCEIVHEIEINGMDNPVIGANAATDGLTVPQGANYTIVSAVWMDLDEGEDAIMFEDGHEYLLRIGVTANEGYEFSKKAAATINGEKVMADVWGKEAYVDMRVSFKKVLSEIRVDNVPTMKVGEKAAVNVTVPADAKYSASVIWSVWNETKEEFEPFEGVFEAGKIYSVGVHISPESGYCFDETLTKFFVDGRECKDAVVYSTGAYYEKDYSTGQKIIDKIEFTVSEPVVGHHASVEPVIKTKDGANYQVSDKGYICWIEGNVEDWEAYEDIFVKDGKYGAHFYVAANSGYVFAENLIVVVNDTVLPKDALNAGIKNVDVNYFFDMECTHYYDNDSDAECNVCGYKREVSGVPKTGDNSQVGLWVICAVLSGMVVVYSGMTRRKKNNY